MTDKCPFCLGREAAEHGLSESDNPFDEVDESDRIAYLDSDYGLWEIGYSVGAIDLSKIKRVRRSD